MTTPVSPDENALRSRELRRQFGRFVAVGPIGVVLGALQYELLWSLNPVVGHRGATTWLVSSIIGVAWVHALHCRFTFRGPQSARWRDTIFRAYLVYSASIALGTGIMWILVDELGMPRTPAWVFTTVLTSLVNFVFLRRLVAGGGVRHQARGESRLRLDELTVIVPTKNERDNVGPFVEALPPGVSLIVVDASNDDTVERLLALRPERTQVIHCRGNIPTARQLGAETATTPWLLFTDVDVSFDSGYFAALEDVVVEGRLGGIAGAKGSRDRYRGYFACFVLGQRLLARLGIAAATGSNMLVRRDALAACGGFDTDLSVNEDTELMWRVQRAGWLVRFESRLTVLERDHRRLERGVTRKVVHTIVRCALLHLGLLPRRWRLADWGYWDPKPAAEELVTRS